MSIDPTHTWSARDRLGLQAQRGFIQSGSPKPAADTAGGEKFGKIIADAAGVEAPDEGANFFGEDGLDFGDFLDLINPLQHLPIISTIYRHLTGDEISQGSRIFGGALYGGPVGLASAVLDAAVEQVSGKDMGALAMSLLDSDEDPATPDTAIADAPNAETSGAATVEAGAKDAAQPDPQAAGADSQGEADDGNAVWMSRIPELSENQMALLLSSLGLPPEANSSSSEGGASADAARSAASVAPAAGDEAPTQTETPQAQIPSEMPPVPNRSVAEAMERALDKYEATFGNPINRGARFDGNV